MLYRNIEYFHKDIEINNGKLFVNGKLVDDEHDIHNTILSVGGFLCPNSNKYAVYDTNKLFDIYNHGYNIATAWNDCPIRSQSQLAYLNPIVIFNLSSCVDIIKALLNRRVPIITYDKSLYMKLQGYPNIKYIKKEELQWYLT